MGSFSSSISSMGRIHNPLTAGNTSPSPLYYRQTKAKNNSMCTSHSSNVDNHSEDDNTKSSSSRSLSDPALPSCSLPAIPSFEELHRRRSGQEETWVKPKRRISFNDHVSVREFECGSSPITATRTLAVPKFIVCPTQGDGDENFDLFPVFPHDPLVMLPRSTSNIKSHGILRRSTDPGIVRRSAGSSALSSHVKGSSPFGLNTLLRQEIRRILMVDPHDIFLALFSKRLQQALPHVTIVTAHSSEEALQVLRQPQQQPFDVIITEERLSLFHRHSSLQFSNLANTNASSSISSPTMDSKPQTPAPASGSALIGHLKQHCSQQYQHSLLIGVSAHWPSDHLIMQQSGADYCWSKAPPPTFHQNLLEELLHTLLLKRGKHDLAKALMVASSAEDATLSASPIQMDRKQ